MTLTQARPGQEPELLRSLNQEPLFHLFLISNLSSGLSPDLEAWYDPTGGVLLRRRSNWMAATGPDPAAFDAATAAAIMDSYPREQVVGLVGRPDAVEPLFAALQHHPGTLYRQFFAAMEQGPAPMTYAGRPRPACPADLDTLAHLYAGAAEMARSRQTIEQALANYWVCEDREAIVSAAYIPARTDRAAMVGGVFTPTAHRGRGYASTLVHAISTALLAEGRRPCLFYHNPDAGRIYLRMGYRDLGGWRMVKFAA